MCCISQIFSKYLESSNHLVVVLSLTPQLARSVALGCGKGAVGQGHTVATTTNTSGDDPRCRRHWSSHFSNVSFLCLYIRIYITTPSFGGVICEGIDLWRL